MKRLSTLGLAAALMAVVVASGCSTDQPRLPDTELRETSPTPAPSPPDEQVLVALSDIEIGLEEVADGFDQPLWLTHAGDGSKRLFVAEQQGRVFVIRDGERQRRPFLDIRRDVSAGGERGLLGLAFAPDYADSGRFYVNYTDTSGDTVIARYIADDPASDSPALEGPQILLRVEQPMANHNGGCTIFGPDGMLWIGMGDGGGAGDPQDLAQDPDSRLGKMLRLDVSGDAAAEPADAPGEGERFIHYSGLRNPWRFSFDRDSGDLWIADVGQSAREEINFVDAADEDIHDFGWSRWEGSEPYPPGAQRSREGLTFPIHEYDRDTGQSITGGYVYRGRRFASLNGIYFYGDFVSGWVAGLAAYGPDGERLDKVETRILARDPGPVASFGEDEDGELYVVAYTGTIYRITAE